MAHTPTNIGKKAILLYNLEGSGLRASGEGRRLNSPVFLRKPTYTHYNPTVKCYFTYRFKGPWLAAYDGLGLWSSWRRIQGLKAQGYWPVVEVVQGRGF